MPREQIVPMSLAMIDNDPKRTTPVHGEAWASPGLHVGWMPSGETGEGHVQLCIEVDRRYTDFAAKQTDDVVGKGSPLKIWSESLDRVQLNKLIRTLRNARDKAYGRDE